jgi:hypothetical protein
MMVGAALGAAYAFFRKRVAAVATTGHSPAADHGHHVEFEPLREKLMTPFNWILLLLVAFCGASMVARFALGLGGSTGLSDTYPWGLWILFDLVWIAVAASTRSSRISSASGTRRKARAVSRGRMPRRPSATAGITSSVPCLATRTTTVADSRVLALAL